jgi:hypothetical protein
MLRVAISIKPGRMTPSTILRRTDVQRQALIAIAATLRMRGPKLPISSADIAQTAAELRILSVDYDRGRCSPMNQ